jgi:hypothetical protein
MRRTRISPVISSVVEHLGLIITVSIVVELRDRKVTLSIMEPSIVNDAVSLSNAPFGYESLRCPPKYILEKIATSLSCVEHYCGVGWHLVYPIVTILHPFVSTTAGLETTAPAKLT